MTSQFISWDVTSGTPSSKISLSSHLVNSMIFRMVIFLNQMHPKSVKFPLPTKIDVFENLVKVKPKLRDVFEFNNWFFSIVINSSFHTNMIRAPSAIPAEIGTAYIHLHHDRLSPLVIVAIFQPQPYSFLAQDSTSFLRVTPECS